MRAGPGSCWVAVASTAAVSSLITTALLTEAWRPAWRRLRDLVDAYTQTGKATTLIARGHCQCCEADTHVRSLFVETKRRPTSKLIGGQKRTDHTDPSPRSNYLGWEEYFMSVAILSAQRSKDPNKQVGACIVSKDKIILGIGYNGFPRGCPDNKLSWAKKSATGNPLSTKYPYVCHAEMNAIMNKNSATVSGSKMYVTMFPCNECAKLMIQAGIEEVVFLEGKVNTDPVGSPSSRGARSPDPCYEASRRLMDMAGITYRQLSMQHHLQLTPVSGCEPMGFERQDTL